MKRDRYGFMQRRMSYYTECENCRRSWPNQDDPSDDLDTLKRRVVAHQEECGARGHVHVGYSYTLEAP